ncbi:hypothetical protein M0Q39_07030 [Patescibacteria group bacterium]|nr:hypothetical protein [Patescibacteria group bacterium]
MNNAAYLTKDLIEGDNSIAERDDFLQLSPYEINKALNIIINNPKFSEQTKKYLIANTWAINYKVKPPTIDEFLSPEWIGPMSESVFSYWRDYLKILTNIERPEYNSILYSPIGTGKSTFVALLNLYVSCLVYLMRNPKKTLGQSSSSSICNVFIAQSLEKATEVLLDPFKNILMVSDKFVQCRTLDQMRRLEKELGPSKICWTTSGMASAMTIGSNMSIKIKSNSASLLGLTILCGSITELAFFKEVGYSDEDIMKLYNDLKGRIHSRFPKKNGFNFSILDSSPNDATFESSIDYWIMNKAKDDPTNLIFNDTKWNLQPWLFPDWLEDKSKVFYIHKGDKHNKIPKVYEKIEETQSFDERDIVECPIDILQLAINDTAKTLKDYAGIPTAASNRLIQDTMKIEKIFEPWLRNVYSHITALETEDPEHLIWNKIQDQFFVKIGNSNFEFWRNPQEVRFLSVDQSISGDTASIALSHPELLKSGDIIDVVDFTINIIPNKARINLDAIKFFIYDLQQYGKIHISNLSFDQFQSESAQQFLKRKGFEVERLSVDSSTTPYLSLVQAVNLGRIKMGKNIYVKNNLKSIKMSATKTGRPKVDHELGKVENSLFANDDWETSSLGFNAKDATDAIAASIELRKKYFVGSPKYIYEPMVNEKGNQKRPSILEKNLLCVREE